MKTALADGRPPFADRGIFYIDNGHSFDEVLFYGSEFLLVQFELMLFAAVVCVSGCFLTATIVVGLTYTVNNMLCVWQGGQ